jgi:Xaa-Pro aminopeptidase
MSTNSGKPDASGYGDDGKRSHDAPTPAGMAEFIKQGWASTPLLELSPDPVIPYARTRQKTLSAHYAGVRLVIPAGRLKVRSNDTDYKFRAHSAFTWLTGITASDGVPDSALVFEPTTSGHEVYLYTHPRSDRNSEGFFTNSKHGEFWIGRRMTLEETAIKYGMATRDIQSIGEILNSDIDTVILRGVDKRLDKQVSKEKKREKNLLTILDELRLIKDAFEVKEMQKAIGATIRGFADCVRALPAAKSVSRGERIIEAAFFGRARLEGNELGYDTIAASGSHACILHWTRNDGAVRNGDLILIDAGVEAESLYTADITRTIPVNGKFTPEQRELYLLVYNAQRAGFAAIKPGVPFKAVHEAAQAVLAKGLEELGVLPVSAEESLKPDAGYHRRWTVHGTCHMLGLDVHDCANAREENYRKGVIEEGMIFTVEPGLYIHEDDELFPEKYRGIGIRIEDDILVTRNGCEILSRSLPSHPDEIEVWMANISRA